MPPAASFEFHAKVKKVDFGSTDDLKAALAGQDAVVDCTLVQDDTPKRLIDASLAAGVYRYIPSDWSLDPLNNAANALPVFSKRVERDNYLYERCKSSQSNMTWTIVANGPFLDWNLRTGFAGIDLFNKRAELMNGGDNQVVWTTLDSVGKAVAGIMEHPEETQNRPVYVQSVVKSCHEMLKHAQAVLGADGWQVINVNAEEANNKALAELHSGKFDMATFGTLIRYSNAKPETFSPWAKTDNGLLRVPSMTDDELEGLIRKVSASAA
ncbi:putative isoflavone reductase family protein [Diaporthe ampelina]|uniref:Putative isoflavone reductase family protein n=1 Tax=Diaporthe ampelina TaxID=1214573 RepID=A0A0G2H5R0_9PEZI|nr:putative isoflavone reductase family protein [Diaporthe ampelina]